MAFSFSSINDENAAQEILDLCAVFDVPQALMTNRLTHLRNETIRLLRKSLKVPHHFTPLYTPWSTGSVERLSKELFLEFRSVISELNMRAKE